LLSFAHDVYSSYLFAPFESSAAHLSFSNTSFGTTLPANLGTALPGLQYFIASKASISGNLAFLSGMVESKRILVDQNKMTGNLPTVLGDLANLFDFEADDNLLTGTLPTELALLSVNLAYIYLYSNQLHGTIPPLYGHLSNLDIFHVEGNQLTGAVDVSICNVAADIGVDCGTNNSPVSCSLCPLICCCSLLACGDN
jgi:hypothetical protein